MKDDAAFGFFFIASRRRHTRYWRDWSSDRVLFRSLLMEKPTASSLLHQKFGATPALFLKSPVLWLLLHEWNVPGAGLVSLSYAPIPTLLLSCSRSEERRVGKECRSRWSPYH